MVGDNRSGSGNGTRVLYALCALWLAGCASGDQARLVGRTVMPGMPMEQALWRLSQEGFQCDERQAAPAIVCVRDQPRLVRSACIEQVELRRRPDQTVATVDVAPTQCNYL